MSRLNHTRQLAFAPAIPCLPVAAAIGGGVQAALRGVAIHPRIRRQKREVTP